MMPKMFAAKIYYQPLEPWNGPTDCGATYRCEVGVAIGAEGNGNEDQCSPDVDGHCQDIAHQRVIAHATQDGGQECAEPIEQNVLTELNHSTEEQFRITQCNAHLLPAELVTAHVFATLLIAHPHHPSLLFVEEIGLGGVVWQTKPDEDGTKGAEQAFNDVDPSVVC